jgi:hypothetical protein
MADSFKASRKVHSPYLLKKELELIFDKGLLLSSYNIYSQFTPWQMETSILELVALEIAYHAGGLSTYEITKKWTEPVGQSLSGALTSSSAYWPKASCTTTRCAANLCSRSSYRTKSFASTGPRLGIVTMITAFPQCVAED